MNIELYALIQEIKKTVQHDESKEKLSGSIEGVMNRIIALLKDREYDYEPGILYPNPLQISDTISGQSIINHTTKDCYTLKKV